MDYHYHYNYILILLPLILILISHITCKEEPVYLLKDAEITADELPVRQIEGTRFSIVRKRASQAEALTICERTGREDRLAVFSTKNEAYGISLRIARDISEKYTESYETTNNTVEWGPERRYWIGLIDYLKEGDWQWVKTNGEFLTYNFWTDGQPDHNTDRNPRHEHCAALWNPNYFLPKAFHTFNDEDCRSKYYFICEDVPRVKSETDTNDIKNTTISKTDTNKVGKALAPQQSDQSGTYTKTSQSQNPQIVSAEIETHDVYSNFINASIKSAKKFPKNDVSQEYISNQSVSATTNKVETNTLVSNKIDDVSSEVNDNSTLARKTPAHKQSTQMGSISKLGQEKDSQVVSAEIDQHYALSGFKINDLKGDKITQKNYEVSSEQNEQKFKSNISAGAATNSNTNTVLGKDNTYDLSSEKTAEQIPATKTGKPTKNRTNVALKYTNFIDLSSEVNENSTTAKQTLAPEQSAQNGTNTKTSQGKNTAVLSAEMDEHDSDSDSVNTSTKGNQKKARVSGEENEQKSKSNKSAGATTNSDTNTVLRKDNTNDLSSENTAEHIPATKTGKPTQNTPNATLKNKNFYDLSNEVDDISTRAKQAHASKQSAQTRTDTLTSQGKYPKILSAEMDTHDAFSNYINESLKAFKITQKHFDVSGELNEQKSKSNKSAGATTFQPNDTNSVLRKDNTNYLSGENTAEHTQATINKTGHPTKNRTTVSFKYTNVDDLSSEVNDNSTIARKNPTPKQSAQSRNYTKTSQSKISQALSAEMDT